MKHLILAVSIFLVYNSTGSVTENCRVWRSDNLFIIENELISQTYNWNNGNLQLIEIKNKINGKTVGYAAGTFPEEGNGELVLPFFSGKPSNGKFEQKVTAKSDKEPEYLQVDVFFELDEIQVKRVFKMYPGIAAVAIHYEFKGKSSRNLQVAGNAADNGRQMIEDANYQPADGSEVPGIGRIPLNSNHWNFKIVEFTEATDHNNTLVQEDTYVAYTMPAKVQGNLMLAYNKSSNTGLFILKESPSSDNQQYYPGFDFSFSQKEIRLFGTGIHTVDLSEQEWLRGYGYVIGIGDDTEYMLLHALKSYQKKIRALLPYRDEMILMNTWGDRSRDSRMNEQFILNELKTAAKLGITHLQLDDGWQQGLSKNSASKEGKIWNDWSIEDWQAHNERFPNGLTPVLQEAAKKNIEICLWFNPSKAEAYANWKRDADILIDYYKKHGIKTFKIDGVDFPDKEAEINLRKLFDRVYEGTDGNVTFNLDATAGRRAGYHYFTEYGNIFLENRYTDWGNYYPHYTLRNLWMLSKYVPAEKLQIEFLNKWRNTDRYPEKDELAPRNIPFEYAVAISFIAQPLAWLESSNLPDEAFTVAETLKKYAEVQHDIHSGLIFPVGEEPDGFSWTGFQSVHKGYGYLMIFRENNNQDEQMLPVWLEAGQKVKLTSILGEGNSGSQEVSDTGSLKFKLPGKNTFCLYRYEL